MTTFGKMSLCRQNVVPFFFVPGRRRLLAGQGQLERFRLGVKLVVWCPVVLWSVAFRFIDDVDAVVGNRRDVQPVEVNRQLVVCCCCSCGALGWGRRVLEGWHLVEEVIQLRQRILTSVGCRASTSYRLVPEVGRVAPCDGVRIGLVVGFGA